MQKVMDVYNSMASGEFLPVYLFAGTETYLKEELLRTLSFYYLGKEDALREVRRVEGGEMTLPEILKELGQRELFHGGRKIAVIKKPPFLEAPSSGKKASSGPGAEEEEDQKGEEDLASPDSDASDSPLSGKEANLSGKTGKVPGAEDSSGSGSRKKSGKEGKERSQKEAEALQEFWEKEASRKVPEGVLVLLVDNCDRRRKLYRLLEDRGAVVDCAPLKGAALKKWVTRRVKNNGKEIHPAAAEKLVMAAEGDMLRLTFELDKIFSYMEDETVAITPEIVDELVTSNPRGNIFALVDALGEGDLSTAYLQLQALYALGEPPLKILFMIVRHFRLLLSAHSLCRKGYTSRELPGMLQVHSFVARKLVAQSGRFTSSELGEVHRLLHRADLEIKTGRLDPYRGLELLVGELNSVGGRKQENKGG